MKCSNPKKIIINKNGTDYPVFVPCGKCYACQNMSRAEWALRCKYELKKTKCLAFVTLTYDNDKLPHTCPDREFKHLVKIEEQKKIYARRWTFARLNKQHASNFVKSMQKWIKKKFDNKDLLFRVFLSAEYGDVTLRPHLHCIIFSPVELHLPDWQRLISDCWKFGKYDIQLNVGSAAINYVAKHQVKTCAGCEIQQKEAPIFKIVSRYKGGLGYNMKDDETLRNTYFDDEKDNVIDVLQGNITYKVAFPRYLLKHLHKENLTETELSNLSNVSRENRDKQVSEILVFRPDLVVYKENGDYDYDETIKKVRQFTSKRDKFQRENYERAKKLKKVTQLTLIDNNYFI